MSKSYHSARPPQGWRACKESGDVGEQLLIRVMRQAGYHVLRQADGEAAGFDLQISARRSENRFSGGGTGNVAVELSRVASPAAWPIRSPTIGYL